MLASRYASGSPLYGFPDVAGKFQIEVTGPCLPSIFATSTRHPSTAYGVRSQRLKIASGPVIMYSRRRLLV